ncbi:hypothetical protein WOLCODRAFT_163555 [Wolfiporia cocos MD-104 SS10]|uniref:Uncharacterized protein n=1 Tax=Wolfiporia cocos (strain MD-104) TaxID=742152 RepID=A0A2H3JIY5_WOLCO|nr:hypothetical protein WOLCODRAFT_163555 [Wolfiporia cocos MD-104 SS10]
MQWDAARERKQARPTSAAPALSVPAESGTTENATTIIGDPQREERIYHELKRLGAPETTQEELSGLYNGPFGEALAFVVEHLRGRSETTACRNLIQTYRQLGSSGKPSANPALYEKSEIAAKRLLVARDDLNAVQSSCDEQRAALLSDQREADRLQLLLREKQQTTFLLQALTRKELIRNARIEQLALLIENHIKSSSGINDTPTPDSSPVPFNVESVSFGAKPIRADHTQNVLAAIRAHLLRISHSSDDARDMERRAESDARLRNTLANAVNLPEDHPKVSVEFDNCRRLAAIRAVQRSQYSSPLPSTARMIVAETDLNEIHRRATEKEAALQHKSDYSIALLRACEDALKSIQLFSDTRVPALLNTLREREEATKGYVGILESSISHWVKKLTGEEHPDLTEVQALRRMLTDVQNDIQQAHEREQFLQQANLLLPHAPGSHSAYEEMTATHARPQARTDERISKLLMRKLEKARVGNILEKDIKRLASEISFIAGSSGS